MAKIKGGIALGLEFLPRADGLFVRFSVTSKEAGQWRAVFLAFKEKIPLGDRMVITKEPLWVWEVGPVEGHIEKALSEIFENFASALACWRQSPTLPGFEFAKEEGDGGS